MDDIPNRLAQNVKTLRTARGLTQEQMAKASGLPRATWQHLESGVGNPTLNVLHRAALALQVSLEELVAPPRSDVRLHLAATLPVRQRGTAIVRKLLPDPIPGMEIDRIELPVNGRLTGVPHTPGTREYLTVETGAIELVASGQQFRVSPGDVVSFRGDQRHSYVNVAAKVSVGYSVVVLAPSS